MSDYKSDVRGKLLDKVSSILKAENEDLDLALVKITATVGSFNEDFLSYRDDIQTDIAETYMEEEEVEEEIEYDEDGEPIASEKTATDNTSKEALIEKEVGKALKQYEYYDIFEFIALTGLFAYKENGFDCDVLEKSFGYVGCLNGIIEYFNGKNKKAEAKSTFSALKAIERGIDFEEYVEDDCFKEDVEHIASLFTKTAQDTANAQNYYDLGEVLTTALSCEDCTVTLTDRLTYIMESAFAQNEYLGIWTGDSTKPVAGLKNQNIYPVEPINIFNNQFTQVFNKMQFNTGVSEDIVTSRNFDLHRIFNRFNAAYKSGSLDAKGVTIQPLYFPYKMLEVIRKGQYQRKSKGYNYPVVSAKDRCNLKAFVKYEVEEMTKDVRYIISLSAAYWVFSNRPDWFEDTIKSLNIDFNAQGSDLMDELDKLIVPLGKLAVSSELGKLFNDNKLTHLQMYLNNSIQYCTDCMTNCILLYKRTHKELGEKFGQKQYSLSEFYFKICIKDNGIIPTNLDGIYSVNRNFLKIIYEDKLVVDDIDSNIKMQSDKRGRFMYYDFKHVADKNFIDSIPLFAYKALDALKDRQVDKGYPISWENILLGKNNEDVFVFSGDKGAINMQENATHFVFAGSRSGKGVMCYNLFATAAASNLPIFYMDRKPDTAVALTGIAPNMYAINGGDFSTFKEEYKANAPAGAPVMYKENNKPIVPPCLSSLQEKQLYDMMYMRGYLLVRQLLAVCENGVYSEFISKFNSMFYDKNFDGVPPFVIVLDEITNFLSEELIDKKVKNAIQVEKFAQKLDSKIAEIGKAKKSINSAIKSKSDTADAEQSLMRAEQSEISIEQLYWTAFHYGTLSVVEAVKGKANASASYSKNVHTFIIGQSFKSMMTALEHCTELSLEKKETQQLYAGGVELQAIPRILEATANAYGCDYFIGYNMQNPNTLNQLKNKRVKSNLNANRRCFAYKKDSFSIDTLKKIEDTENALKSADLDSYLDSWKMIKPFVILNNSQMPPEVLSDTATTDEIKSYKASMEAMSNCVGQCIAQSALSGIKPSELIAENCMDGDPTRFNPAIGFEDYIKSMTSDENGTGDISGIAETLNKSGQIMDLFVQTFYGYPGGWRDFIRDLRPEWIITMDGEASTGGTRPTTPEERLSRTFFNKRLLTYDLVGLIGATELDSLATLYGNTSVDMSGEGIFKEDESEIPDFNAETENNTPDSEPYGEEEIDVTANFDDIFGEPANTNSGSSEDTENLGISTNFGNSVIEPAVPNGEPFGGFNLGFDTESTPMEEEPVQEPADIRTQIAEAQKAIQSIAYDNIYHQVVNNVMFHYSRKLGDWVYHSEEMQHAVENLAKLKTMQYLQEKGV